MEKGLNMQTKVLTGYEAHKIAASIDMHNPIQKIPCPICQHNHLHIERITPSENGRGTVIVTCSNCGMGTHFTTAYEK